ncbi:GlsB/YeaQ/YmgE family stress response membrane protein [Streptomyces sp. NPDC090054]|uniref:GlsB/YeaQ/YmgE family stress response membrane protein n=1 Tax=Streptomyces sp. NPDC090054 TaxID=3365933 RepID=UPI0038256B62
MDAGPARRSVRAGRGNGIGIGIAGGLLGGWLGKAIFGVESIGFFHCPPVHLSTWIAAIVDSVILLIVHRLIPGSRPPLVRILNRGNVGTVTGDIDSP